MIVALFALLAVADVQSVPVPAVEVNITLVQAGKFLPKSVNDTEFRGAVVNVVRDEGGTLTSATDAGASCVAPDCFEKLAAPGATHVLLVEGKRLAAAPAPEYAATVSLWNIAKREFVGRDADAGCRACVGQELVQKISGRIRRLVIEERTRLKGEALAAAVPSTVPAARPAVAPATTSPPAIVAPAAPRTVETPPSWFEAPWIGGSLIAVGVGAIVGGAYLIHLDGKGADCDQTGCWSRYRTAPPGYALAGAGVVIGALGAWRLWTSLSDRTSTSFIVGPGSIALAGRF